MLMVMVFGPGIDLDDAEVQSAWHSTMTIVMLAGLIPAGEANPYPPQTLIRNPWIVHNDAHVQSLHGTAAWQSSCWQASSCRSALRLKALNPERVKKSGPRGTAPGPPSCCDESYGSAFLTLGQ